MMQRKAITRPFTRLCPDAIIGPGRAINRFMPTENRHHFIRGILKEYSVEYGAICKGKYGLELVEGIAPRPAPGESSRFYSTASAPASHLGAVLHEFFERQADARAEEIALICADERMTYGELERQANQLGMFLRNC